MKTTINKIYEFAPCQYGFAKLIGNIFGIEVGYNLNIARQIKMLSKEQRNQKITLLQILDSNGFDDAVWAFRCFDYKDYCEIVMQWVESVEKYTYDPRVSACNKAVRDYNAGRISIDGLRSAESAARSASAAESARLAAESARSAAESAWLAAESAVWSARLAVWSARLVLLTGCENQEQINEKIMRDYLELVTE